MKQQEIVDTLFANKAIMNAYYDAVDIARQAIDDLTKQMISELRSFNNPPPQVEPVVEIIAQLIGKAPPSKPKSSWFEIKKLFSLEGTSKNQQGT